MNGEFKGLSEWAKADEPPVLPVFLSFRLMVGLGLLMVAIGITSAVQYYRGKLFETRWLHIGWMLMMPSGFIALLAGWFVTEIGRQPYVAYGIIRTAEAVSPAIMAYRLPGRCWRSYLCTHLYLERVVITSCA